ncbi:DUF2065 domain-containing protein [Ancylobacter sp. 6x-1]|uniref:DUF2065 domain-containing protein n=1 Tax=Ancylobacter crimeensis TaxID=2579147 RepID=A0ABT0DET6_9HYPH|nr:DUF2065 domain-containing protein [Ancylobacter crimeensis]MCK0198272.1 DUF2065 domain-containing protein [Ancylobacter crimeensis]
MSDLIVALGLVFVMEGLMLAAFPAATRQAMATLHALPDHTLRILGICGGIAGLVVVWLVRG